jgi:hypothetical protein
MITDLPILYIEKQYPSVIKNRLASYNKAYSFNSINEFNNLIYKYKQNYFYTIEPNVYFNSFWDDYFNHYKIEYPIYNKNLVLITSKIYVSDKEFTYISTRSIYSSEERFNQTIETIDSIRKYIPNSYIILFDNSDFNNHDINEINILNNLVDNFINITDDKILNYYTDDYPYKALSEMSQQLKFYNVFLKNINVKQIKNFYKISGRYLVNKNFNYKNFDNNYNILKKNIDVTDREYYYTSFYKLEKNTLDYYFNKLSYYFNHYKNYTDIVPDIEVIVPFILKNNFAELITLGITQRIAVWKEETLI